MKAKTVSARRRLLLGGAVLGVVLLGVFTLPLQDWLGQAQDLRIRYPVMTALIYVLSVILATPLMVPGSILMMSGGFLFGVVKGAALAAVSITLGATAACLAGRTIARPAVADLTSKSVQFRALDSALQQRGFLVVALTRLSLLIPFNLLNYAYGVTSIRLPTYIMATGLGMIPGVILFSYIGSLAGDVETLLQSGAGSGATGKVVIVVGLLAIVAATYVIHITATRELKKHMTNH